jgi:very-short-patch-repair endonuclease
VIELDGGQHARLIEDDKWRTKELESRGFTVIRFWDDDVLQRTDQVLESIYRCLLTPSAR